MFKFLPRGVRGGYVVTTEVSDNVTVKGYWSRSWPVVQNKELGSGKNQTYAFQVTVKASVCGPMANQELVKIESSHIYGPSS